MQQADSTAEKDFIEHNTDIKNFLSICKHKHILVETKTGKKNKQTSEKLLDEIENCLYMYVKAQENRVRCELQEELSKKEKEIQELKMKLQPEGKHFEFFQINP